jgi:hypothetical protein
MIMPDMSGGDTYDRLQEIDPDIKVLLSVVPFPSLST